MFLALFDLLVAVDPTVGANMARGLWAAYAAGSLSSTYACCLWGFAFCIADQEYFR